MIRKSIERNNTSSASQVIDKMQLHEQLTSRARKHHALLQEAEEIRRSLFDPLGLDPEHFLDVPATPGSYGVAKRHGRR